MEPTTIIDNEYVTLWYHPDAKIVHHAFHKFIYGENFRANLEQGLQIFQQDGATKWLSDDRHNTAMVKEDVEWSNQNWFPRMLESGWRYGAVVMPDKAVGQANMNRIMKAYIDQGLTVQVFDNPDEALQWLEAVG